DRNRNRGRLDTAGQSRGSRHSRDPNALRRILPSGAALDRRPWRYRPGSRLFRLSQEGMNSMTPKEESAVDPVLERVNTGIEAFDDLVMGGLPRRRTTIVGGTPGSGKTVFATQFLAHGISALQEPGVFVTFEESPAEIEVNMASFGWDIRSWRDQKRLAFVDASPRDHNEMVVGAFDLEALLSRIRHAVRD